jgi:mono/diheme cytochrome c family protein
MALLLGCRGTTSSRPPIHLNPNMDQQKRFDPQEPNPFFADGRSMRTPVPGSVPASMTPDDPVFMTGKMGDEWITSLPPGLALDRALLERGQERYEIYCTPCHDAAGTGDGTVAQRAGTWKPPTLHDDRLRALALGQIYDVITNGVRTMPSYASQVSTNDRWAIAAYVRTLQRSRLATRDQVPADVAAQKGW